MNFNGLELENLSENEILNIYSDVLESSDNDYISGCYAPIGCSCYCTGYKTGAGTCNGAVSGSAFDFSGCK